MTSAKRVRFRIACERALASREIRGRRTSNRFAHAGQVLSAMLHDEIEEVGRRISRSGDREIERGALGSGERASGREREHESGDSLHGGDSQLSNQVRVEQPVKQVLAGLASHREPPGAVRARAEPALHRLADRRGPRPGFARLTSMLSALRSRAASEATSAK